jgi:hypothetical protein
VQNVAFEKMLGVAVLTAGVGVAIGGPVIPYSTLYSGQGSTITIVDTRDGHVLWLDQRNAKRGRGGRNGARMIRHTLVNLFEALPNRYGTPVIAVDAADEVTTDEAASTDDAEESAEETKEVDTPLAAEFIEPIDFATAPSVFEDPSGWSAAELKRAYRAQLITPEIYKSASRALQLKYRDKQQLLKQSLRDVKLSDHEHEIEEYRWNWAYRGFY